MACPRAQTETAPIGSLPDPTSSADVATGTPAEPFRFFDNREKYLLFVSTTSEKTEVGTRLGREVELIEPTPPAVRVFDAGTGNGVVLSHVLRSLHRRMPTVPFFVVGKEASMEDGRLTLAQLPDRLAEHPNTVFVLTNMFYAEAPWLWPKDPAHQAAINWIDIPLQGSTSYDFFHQINELDETLADGWQTVTSPKSGNPVYQKPSVMVLYRADQAFALHDVIPKKPTGPIDVGYDLVLAAQPYRSRTPADLKVKHVLGPLARSLAPSGRLVVVQSTGHDPGMEVIRKIWPTEDPFATPRHQLIRELDAQLNTENPGRYRFDGTSDAASLFTYHLHSMPNEVSNRITTSTTLAAWNASVYVAQIEDERAGLALQDGRYLDVTADVLRKHGGLWFQDESFVVVRSRN
jgi:hypothetical protein